MKEGQKQRDERVEQMRKRMTVVAWLLCMALMAVRAGGIDEIRQALEHSSVTQVQEKVYVHTDNTCYFIGDTLWYKAYVVRADDLRPTDMSRLLYVELLSPDGLLVERQTVVVSGSGYACGQFELKDSLYSGYYELRAYTRWMLNFNVREHRYRRDETWWFYNRQMAEIRQREQRGTALVIRPPEALGIGHVSHNPDDLDRVYRIGRGEAERRLPEVCKYLHKTTLSPISEIYVDYSPGQRGTGK